jgi:hypothetical protein
MHRVSKPLAWLRYKHPNRPGRHNELKVANPSYDPPRITIRLPTVTKDAEGNITKKPAYDTSDLPEAYTVDIPLESETSKVHAKPKNTFVFTEKERSWGITEGLSLGKRKREKGGWSYLSITILFPHCQRRAPVCVIKVSPLTLQHIQLYKGRWHTRRRFGQ